MEVRTEAEFMHFAALRPKTLLDAAAAMAACIGGAERWALRYLTSRIRKRIVQVNAAQQAFV